MSEFILTTPTHGSPHGYTFNADQRGLPLNSSPQRLSCFPIPLQRDVARRVTAVEALKSAQRASLAELDALFATLQPLPGLPQRFDPDVVARHSGSPKSRRRFGPSGVWRERDGTIEGNGGIGKQKTFVRCRCYARRFSRSRKTLDACHPLFHQHPASFPEIATAGLEPAREKPPSRF